MIKYIISKNLEENIVSKTAILIIDMINDFVTGVFANPQAQEIIPNIQQLLQYAHQNDLPVIYCSDAHHPSNTEFRIWPSHSLKGTLGAQIIPELSPQPKDFCIEKQTFNAFFKTELEQLLKSLDVTTIILTGVVTDICILHTASEAFFNGYTVKIPIETTASTTFSKKQHALEYMKNTYGTDIICLNQIIQ